MVSTDFHSSPRTLGRRRRLAAVAAALVSAATLSACSGADLNFSLNDTKEGSGTVTTERHEVADFDALSFCCGLDVDVQFEEAATTSVEITLDENLHRYVEVEVAGSELQIKPEDGVDLDPTERMVVTIAGPVPAALEVDAGSNVVAAWPMVSLLVLEVNAGSDLTLEVDVDTLEVDADAGSDIALEGRADFVMASADAAADISLTAVTVEDATVEADAGSRIEIDINGTISGSANAGSDIDVWGDPTRVDIDTDVSSDVNFKN